MRELLRERRFALVWWAGLATQVGSWLLATALPMHVYLQTGSAAATSLLLIAGAVPRVLLGSVAGVYVDRWDRRTTMLVTNLLLAAVALPLLVPGWGGALLAVCGVAALKSVLTQFFTPAEDALLPTLVRREQLATANALNALNNNLARFAGPAIGGTVAVAAGLTGVVLCSAAAYLGAALLMAFVRVPRRPEAPTVRTERFRAAFAAGWRHTRGSRALSVLLLVMAITAVGEGVFGALLAPFVASVLTGGPREYGWLMSAQAVGGVVGGVAIAWAAHRIGTVRLLAAGLFLIGLGDLVLLNYPAIYPHVGPGLALMALIGLPAAASRAGYLTLLQTAAGEGYVGRVSGLIGTVAAPFGLIGMALAGLAAEPLGLVAVLHMQPLVYLVAGALVWLALRGRARSEAGDAARPRAAGQEVGHDA